MAIEFKELSIEKTLDAAAGDLVNSSSNTAIFLGAAVFTNSNSTTEEVTVWRLASGGTATASNYLVKKDIPAGKTWLCRELTGQVVQNGSKIQASSTTAGVVNANVSGTRET